MKFNNKSIRTAVSEWLNSPDSAKKKYGDISDWNTSGVTNMSELFHSALEFNEPIGSWDVSNVKDMSEMFYCAFSFNQPINDWDVSSVESMNSTFLCARSFNQELNSWNVQSVKDMSGMFYAAEKFNQPLNNWNVSNCENFINMFHSARKFNQLLSSWVIGEKGQGKFDNFLMNAISFDQDIWDWIQKYKCEGVEDSFKNVISIGKPGEIRGNRNSIPRAKKTFLLDCLSRFIQLREENIDFSILEVGVSHGWDYNEHPAIRDENEVLSIHSDYDHSIENIECYAVAPSCFYKIQMNDEIFQFVYMLVGIDDPYSSAVEFYGILASDWSDSTDWYRTDVLWNHEPSGIQNEDIAWGSIGKLGSILSNEELSWENFDFSEDLSDESKNIKYHWDELKDYMDL